MNGQRKELSGKSLMFIDTDDYDQDDHSNQNKKRKSINVNGIRKINI